MKLIDLARTMNEKDTTTTESRIANIVSEILLSAKKGESSMRIHGFGLSNFSEASKIANRIKDQLSEFGFTVDFDYEDTTRIIPTHRHYFFNIKW